MKPVQTYNLETATGVTLPDGRRAITVNDVFRFDLEATLAALLGGLIFAGDAGAGLDSGRVDARVWSGGGAGKSAAFLGGNDSVMTLLGAPQRSMVVINCATLVESALLAEALGAEPPPVIPASVTRYWNADNLNVVGPGVGTDVMGWDSVVGSDPLVLVPATPGVYVPTGGPTGGPACATLGGAYFQALFAQTQPYGIALVVSEVAASGVFCDGGALVGGLPQAQLKWDAFENGIYCGGGGTLSTGTPPPAGWYILSVWVQGDSSQIRVNGVTLGTGGGGVPGTGDPNGFTLGAWADGTNLGNALYAHALFTDGADGITGLQDAEDYLSAVTGL